MSLDVFVAMWRTRSLLHLRGFLFIIGSLPAAIAQQLFRTWSNGWTTSWRMNEASALDCICGFVGERDNLSHYIFCPFLWSAMSMFDGLPIAEDALEILAFSKQEFPTAIRLIPASHTYNAARHIHLPKPRCLIASSDLSAITCFFEQSGTASFTL